MKLDDMLDDTMSWDEKVEALCEFFRYTTEEAEAMLEDMGEERD